MLKQYSANNENLSSEQLTTNNESTPKADNDQTVRFVDWIRGDKPQKTE